MQLVLKQNIFKRIIDIVSQTENSDKRISWFLVINLSEINVLVRARSVFY